MMSRRALALSIALLAAAPALAQKPSPDNLDPVRSRYRDSVLAACVADLNSAEGVGPEASESVCGCAAGRFVPRWPAGALPRLEGGRIPAEMGSDLVGCAGQESPGLAASVTRRVAELAVANAPVVDIAPEKPRAPPEEKASSSAGFDPAAWFERLSPPRWLTDVDLPVWVLVPLALFVLLFLRGLMRRSEDKDLLGPPRGPQPPRRP